jgi:hypothetical protein
MRVRSLQCAGGAQFGVEPALVLARLRLLPRDQAGDEHEAGKPRVQQRLHQRFEPRHVQPAHVDRHHQELAEHQPRHARRQRQQPRQHARGDHQQDAAQAAGAVVADRDRTAGQHRQQPVVQRADPAAAEAAGQPSVADAEGGVGDPRLPVDVGADHAVVAQRRLVDRHQRKQQQRHADHRPREQAGVAQQAAMVQAREHAAV